ncbi:MAG: PEGA domain-containing protein [Myxococcota bacterium]
MTHPAYPKPHPYIRLVVAFGLLAVVVGFALVAVTASPALAQSDRERARQIVVEGQRNFKEGRYQEAASQFLEAFQLDPHPVIMYNVARSYEEAGELIQALKYYRQAIQQRPSRAVREELQLKIDDIGVFLKEQGVDITKLDTAEWDPIGLMTVRTDPPGGEVSIDGVWIGVAPIEKHKLSRGQHVVEITRRSFATEERRLNVIPGKTYIINAEMQPEDLADSRVKPGFLELRAPRRGLMVFIDGEPLATTPVGRLELSPGEHTISVEGPDYPTWDTVVTVTSEETTRAVAATPPSDLPQDEDPLLSQSGWGFVTMGTGVAIMGVGGVFGLFAQGQANDYADNRSEPGRASTRDNAQTNALTADVLYGIGFATVVVGGVLVLLDDGAEQPPSDAYGDDLVKLPDVQFGPIVLEGGAGISAQGSW